MVIQSTHYCKATPATVIAKYRFDPDQFERSLYAFSVVDHMAFSKTTSPELVKKIQDAYLELKQEGRIVLR